jgi:hypothetical protein
MATTITSTITTKSGAGAPEMMVMVVHSCYQRHARTTAQLQDMRLRDGNHHRHHHHRQSGTPAPEWRWWRWWRSPRAARADRPLAIGAGRPRTLRREHDPARRGWCLDHGREPAQVTAALAELEAEGMNALAEAPPQELVARINAEHRECFASYTAALEHAINCGNLLYDVRKRLPGGTWGDWLRAIVLAAG